MKRNKQNNKNGSRGFTLIELLVVIAVIGILAAVVLAALNKARDQGRVARIESELTSARSAAELYRTQNGNSYQTLCTANTGIASYLLDATQVFNPGYSNANYAANYAGAQGVSANTRTVCHVSADYTTWAASVPTTSATGAGNVTYWCVDSGGKSVAMDDTQLLGAGVTVCP